MSTIVVHLDKKDIPNPGTIHQSIAELSHWGKVRAQNDLPTGALDNAIMSLKRLHELACVVYVADLNTPLTPEQLVERAVLSRHIQLEERMREIVALKAELATAKAEVRALTLDVYARADSSNAR